MVLIELQKVNTMSEQNYSNLEKYVGSFLATHVGGVKIKELKYLLKKQKRISQFERFETVGLYELILSDVKISSTSSWSPIIEGYLSAVKQAKSLDCDLVIVKDIQSFFKSGELVCSFYQTFENVPLNIYKLN